MRRIIRILPVMFLLIISACKLNESLHINAGRLVQGTQQAINGSVIVGDHCQVKGLCRSINGSVTVGSASKIKSAMAINGGVVLEPGVEVRRDVVAVNGGLTSGQGVHIAGKVKVVNGGVEMIGTKVERDMSVNNGNVILKHGSQLMQDLIIKHEKSSNNDIWIILEGGSIIHGDVINKSENRRIKLIVRSGEVKGRLKGVDLINEE